MKFVIPVLGGLAIAVVYHFLPTSAIAFMATFMLHLALEIFDDQR